ncbi:Sds3-like [Carpediemonas membranifera]|uniref:Sds3-like n=1 Tax=Carpediemonas membranifera TaxID=201153 RepID=A0A8J6AQS2_9EUKA|nr:Sds3-like [Carpediemonas membranifera]|eukprot:KAG9391423.1 Sds3-like [Carpediemonas membranifera]
MADTTPSEDENKKKQIAELQRKLYEKYSKSITSQIESIMQNESPELVAMVDDATSEHEREMAVLELAQKVDIEAHMKAYMAERRAIDDDYETARNQVKNVVLQQINESRRAYADELHKYSFRKALPEVPIKATAEEEAPRRRSTRSTTKSYKEWVSIDPFPQTEIREDLKAIRSGEPDLDAIEKLVYITSDKRGLDLMACGQRFSRGDSIIVTQLRETVGGPDTDPVSYPGQIVTVAQDYVFVRTVDQDKLKFSIPAVRAGLVLVQKVIEG